MLRFLIQLIPAPFRRRKTELYYISGPDVLPQPLSREEEATVIKTMEAGGEGAEEARQILIERNLRLVAFIARRYEKWHLDLWEANRMQLLACDVLPEHIEVAGVCTYRCHEDFFSARRLGIKSGRILSGIAMR